MQKLQATATKQQADFHSRVTKLEDELARREEKLTSLNQKLAQQSDYEELRKELEYVYVYVCVNCRLCLTAPPHPVV